MVEQWGGSLAASLVGSGQTSGREAVRNHSKITDPKPTDNSPGFQPARDAKREDELEKMENKLRLHRGRLVEDAVKE